MVFTGLLHLVFQELGAKGLFIVLASISWMTYVGWRVWQSPDHWRRWGFRTDNLKAALIWPTIVFIIAMVGMLVLAFSDGRELWSTHIPVLLLLYPIWGVLQQFLVQALGVSNIVKLFPKVSSWGVVLLGACLFSVVHVPEWWLMLATWSLGCVFIPSYLQHRNLWILGVYHGWLGTFFYLWVLNQDPWIAAFGT
ncbi:MAG: hypothetical protein NPIRA05_13670 [Nitrospirales bacterium]|nr:MAG: hypothetical protein NPIRA05_13670 [Nitrospirales bacterium]